METALVILGSTAGVILAVWLLLLFVGWLLIGRNEK